MAELGLGALKQRYTPAVLDDIERSPHNVGAKEVRELVRLARWNLADAEGLWVCGAGHVVRLGPDTAPYDADTCPICAALEDADLERAAHAETARSHVQADAELAACRLRLERVEAAARRAYEFLVQEGYGTAGVVDEIRAALAEASAEEVQG